MNESSLDPGAPRQRPTLVDSDGVYCSGEDHIRLTSFNSNATAILALEGRFVRCDGVVVPIVERHIPNTDRSAAVSLVTLAEGFLSNLQIRATTGSPAQGQCYVVVELVRGRTGALQPLACLLEGYVSDVQRLAWPGSPFASSVAGTGVMRAVQGTNPAVNTEISDAVPTGARWRVVSWFATLVADANVANRTVTLIIDDGANTIWTCDASAVQTAGQTRSYNAYATGVAPDLTGSTFRLPAPFPIDLAAGSRIRTSTANRQAGDDWSAATILVEERIAG